MISFDDFLKQDDEEKYNNMQCDIFEIQALKNELENRDIYISKLEVAYSKEIERLNNIINEFDKLIENEINESKLEDNYERVDSLEYCLTTLRELKGSDKE